VIGTKHHVLSENRAGRLICGRIRPRRVTLVGLDQAAADPDLCTKCRKQVGWEIRRREIARAPKPGLQQVFDFVKEWN
jgi:hypothetical protein